MSKSLSAIQAETAVVWGERAEAAYRLFLETRNIQWLLDGEEYYHEALEHAVLASSETAQEVEHRLAVLRIQSLHLR